MQRTHFTADYTLHNCVYKKKRLIISVIVFFQNRYLIMVKSLNIGKNIGKAIYRSISNKNTHPTHQAWAHFTEELDIEDLDAGI